MIHDMTIELDGDRFLIACPMWANDLLADVPKRWQKSLKKWAVPATRMNIDHIERLAKLQGVHTTPAALAHIHDYRKRLAAHDPIKGRSVGFPSWYKFKTEPRKHQHRALAKGYGLHAYGLFMDMQTGKSKTAIDLAAAHRMEDHIQGVLILSKYTLRKNWVRQLALHCPIPYGVWVPDTDKAHRLDAWLKSTDFPILIAGWESLSQGKINELLSEFVRQRRCVIIGDEVTYITNHKAERATQSVKLAHECAYRYALTGTPILEGPMNLFMEGEFLDPDIIGIGDFYAFRNRYAVMGGYMRPDKRGQKQPTQIVGYKNMDELTKTVAPYVFEVLKADAYDLPPKLPPKRYDIELLPVQYELMKKVRTEGLLPVKGGEPHVLANVLEVALRQHQIAGGYTVRPKKVIINGRTGPREETVFEPVELMPPAKNPKMKELVAIVEEIGNRKQGLIWAVYMPEILAIVGLLRKMGLKVGELHGGIKEQHRQPMVDEFQKGGYQWVVGNASTGGMGYTMMAASVNMFYNNTFKMIDRVQAEDRCYGDGQTQAVALIDLVGERSPDGLTIAAIEEKVDVATYVRGRIRDAINILDGKI